MIVMLPQVRNKGHIVDFQRPNAAASHLWNRNWSPVISATRWCL